MAAGSRGQWSDRHGVLSIIRRWALREHLSIRKIARRTKLSRNTIRKYLRSGAVEPEFSVPERPGKLDPHATKLAVWLKTGAGKSRKQRRTSKQLHEDLVKPGYTGSYGRIGAQTRDIVDPACLKARQQGCRRKTRINAHHGHVAEALPRPVHSAFG